ncbi:protein-L-isoaspartate(D-aspartate) O-methyltransferase [Rhodopirellula sallentina]|uniref:Protein-L-isoaspartate O-methyltransferase n=1 Tax=Rhodopirellula sallentina SM41 TaxID=1263870 RepID=M5UFF5_9BACT|nr:protein-L-isoaspartate(D-aspartate) O-methyltransferase [Rhodopirellula sallentina]EMI56581.1 Protein-L-isoaspartate(D-aspartate) O-methyltransferase [Rhodopirellula sallentina SM41]
MLLRERRHAACFLSDAAYQAQLLLRQHTFAWPSNTSGPMTDAKRPKQSSGQLTPTEIPKQVSKKISAQRRDQSSREQANLDQSRLELVEALRGKGIHDRRILDAIGRVRRDAFVPDELKEAAYHDIPLPIGQGQTISQPLVVAWMADAMELQPTDHVLDVGTGSGYAAAVMSLLCATVHSVERIPELAQRAKARLIAEGYENVSVRCGDGHQGWPEHAPFDGICIAAAGREIPAALRDQLVIGGRIIAPLGNDRSSQTLYRLTRTDEHQFKREKLGKVRFVPLIGAAGWDEGH